LSGTSFWQNATMLTMKITICSSMTFAQDMVDAKKFFEKKGWKVVLPDGIKDYINDTKWKRRAMGWGTIEGAKRKIENDLIIQHYKDIKKSDGILVINKTKNRIRNYIGGNTFLEMGFAHVLKKKIFVLNPLPTTQKMIYQELVAMRPIILKGDLKKIQL
jgi:hypothetical protein